MTAMTEITRNGAKSARGLVSIQSRYNQILDDSSSTGKKLTAWYKDHNIAIKDQNGQLKSFFEVGGKVAEQWDKMSDNEKKYYMNIQAGANQSQNLAALMKNYKTALDATAVAEESAGSAARENARYMDSMEGKLQNLRSSWEKLSYKLINSDEIKKGIDAVTKALDYLSSDAGVKLINSLELLAGAFAAFKVVSGIASALGSFAGALGTAEAAAAGAEGAVAGLAGVFSGGAVAWGLLGAAGIVAGILELNKAIDGITDPDELYANTKKELEELKEKYKEVNDEIANLEKKGGESGEGLTNAEKQRLAVLKEQSAELEKQIELKRKLANQQWEKKETSPQTKNQNVKDATSSKMAAVGKGSANVMGGIAESTAKAMGYTDKLNAKMQDFKRTLSRTGEEYRKTGKMSDDAASKQQQGIDGIKKKQKEWIKHWGDVKKMPVDIYNTYKASKKLTNSYDKVVKLTNNLAGNDWGSQTEKQIDDANTAFIGLGESIGVSVDESGKLERINYDTFTTSLQNAGMTAEQAEDALKTLGETEPDVKVNIDGVDVALDQVDQVNDFLGKLNGDDAEATVEIGGVDYAVKDIGSVQNYVDALNYTEAHPKIEVDGGDEAKSEIQSIKNDNIPDKTAQVKTSGTEESANKVDKVTGSIKKVPRSTTPKVHAKVSGQGKVADLHTEIRNLPDSKYVDIYVRKHGSAKIDEDKNAQGTRNAAEGLSEVNEQGFEFIRDAKTGKLRIAGGGKRTVTKLNKGDIVYTHEESKRMMSDGKDIEIPQHKKGTSKKEKEKRQKEYDKQRDKIDTHYENEMTDKEHDAKVKHWTDNALNKEKNKIIRAWKKAVNNLNSTWKGKGVTVRKYDKRENDYPVSEERADIQHDKAVDKIEAQIDKYSKGHASRKSVQNLIKNYKDKGIISATEASNYKKQLKELDTTASNDKEKDKIEKKINDFKEYGKGSKDSLFKYIESAFKNKQITKEERDEYKKQIKEIISEGKSDATHEKIEREIDGVINYGKDSKKALKLLRDALKKKQITKQEYDDYIKQITEFKASEQRDKETENIEKDIESGNYASAESRINALWKNRYITTSERQEFLDRIKEAKEEAAEKEKEEARSKAERAYTKTMEAVGDAQTSAQARASLKSATEQVNAMFKQGLITAEEKEDYLAEIASQTKELDRHEAERDLSGMMEGLSKGGSLKDVEAKIADMYSKGLITEEEKEDYLKEATEAAQEYKHEQATKAIESFMSGARGTDADFAKMKQQIEAEAKAGNISAEEREAYLKEAYKQNLDYNMKLFASNKKTYKDMRATLESYYKQGMLTAAEYYEYLESLMQEQLAQQEKALEKMQTNNSNAYSLAQAYVNKQIKALQEDNDELDKQNQLIELQANLEKAKNQKIKVYREGVGFVYEQNTEAVKEATKALQDFHKEEKSPELQKWEAISDLFGELEEQSALKELEVKLGTTAQALVGGLGTDINKWTAWIKNNLATGLGYTQILEAMGELTTAEDIDKFLSGANDTISQSYINSMINKNRFASGTLSARGGLARVAENGYEIALLGKGDAVMPHGVSKNLMDWGQYSPKDFINQSGDTIQQYSFDKLVLPNVENAHDFIRELELLPNKALQYGTSRGY